jgi:hypothetical protein
VRFQAVFYKSGRQPREFTSRLTKLAEARSVANKVFFILPEYARAQKLLAVDPIIFNIAL